MADVLAGRHYEAQAAPRRRPRSLQRVLVALIVVLTLALVAEVIYHAVVAPRLTVKFIDVVNELSMSDDELLGLAGIGLGTAFFKVNESAIVERIKRHPSVRDAYVERIFPDTIRMGVTARTPLGVALATTSTGVSPLVFDEEGVVFAVGLADVAVTKTVTEGSAALPVVSGLRFADARPGLELPQLMVKFLHDLRQLKDESPALFDLFSEYRIVRKNDFAYEVVLYPMHFSVPVRIGTSINSDMVQYIMMMLDMLRREGRLESVSELDFRTGEGVLTTKEDPDA